MDRQTPDSDVDVEPETFGECAPQGYPTCSKSRTDAADDGIVVTCNYEGEEDPSRSRYPLNTDIPGNPLVWVSIERVGSPCPESQHEGRVNRPDPCDTYAS